MKQVIVLKPIEEADNRERIASEHRRPGPRRNCCRGNWFRFGAAPRRAPGTDPPQDPDGPAAQPDWAGYPAARTGAGGGCGQPPRWHVDRGTTGPSGAHPNRWPG